MSAPDPADVAACRSVLLGFLGAIDRGRATAGLSAFTPDASFVARGTRFEGHDGIMEFLGPRERETGRHTVHVIANDTARVLADGGIEITAMLVLHVRRPDGAYEVERVLDTVQRFVHTEAGWLIAQREAGPLHPA